MVKNIKEDLNKKRIKNYLEFNQVYSEYISSYWDRIKDIYVDNLSYIYREESFLIEEVINIHRLEESDKNKKIYKENIHLGSIINNLEDKKRALNIYSFNKKDGNYYIIGDIHGDTVSIETILEKTNFFEKIFNGENINLIFLGDYVDRGKNQIKTLHYLLSLKYLFPENIFLLKGNHDDGSLIDGKIKMPVRLPKEAKIEDWFLPYLEQLSIKNLSFPRDYINKILSFFDSLGVIGFIKKEEVYMLAHGGIPRYRHEKEGYYEYLERIADLTDEKILDKIGRTIVKNILWSDPALDGSDLREDNGRFRFTYNHFEEFRKKLGFDFFLRGHQVKEAGYERIFENKLTTIFSSGSIYRDGKNINNETAYKKVDPKIGFIGGERFKIIGLNKKTR